MEIKKVHIILAFKPITKDSHIYSKMVGWWTKSNYGHVEIIIDDSWIAATEFEGVSVNILRPLSEKWHYKDLGYISVTEQQYLSIMKWIIRQDGMKYDWLAIFLSYFIPLRVHSLDNWVCSELVAKLLQLFLIPQVIGIEPHTQSPGDLAKIFNLE